MVILLRRLNPIHERLRRQLKRGASRLPSSYFPLIAVSRGVSGSSPKSRIRLSINLT